MRYAKISLVIGAIFIGVVSGNLMAMDSQSTIEYNINGNRLEMAIGNPDETTDSSPYFEEVKVTYIGSLGEFIVKGYVSSTSKDNLFLGLPIAVAVMGSAMDVPDSGMFEVALPGGDLMVLITQANSFTPASDDWLPTVISSITPVAVINGVFPDVPPPILESIMGDITGIAISGGGGTGNVNISFEEVVVNAIRQWKVTVTDQNGEPVPEARLTHIVPRVSLEPTLGDFIIVNRTDENGVAIFGASTLESGTQIYFVATKGGQLGGTIAVVPPSAQ